MYTNQNVSVMYKNCISKSWKLSNGVRQGGILSPLLFSIYINELIDRVSSCGVGCRLGFFVSNIITYADDLVVLGPSKGSLQHILDICYRTANELNLNFNAKKSVCVVFRNSPNVNKSYDHFKFFLGNKILGISNEVKYLGFNIMANLCNKQDIIKERNKFYNSFNSILRKFSVNLDVFMVLMKSFCFNFYGIELRAAMRSWLT